MTDLTSEQLADAIRRGLRENWLRMARRYRSKAHRGVARGRVSRPKKTSGAKAPSARR